MTNIIKKILLKQQVKNTIKNGDVIQLYNMNHVQFMVTHVAYRIENDSMSIFASQYWDHAQGTIYESNITDKNGKNLCPDMKLARKIFMRLQNKYAQQIKR